LKTKSPGKRSDFEKIMNYELRMQNGKDLKGTG
jgi:hypothetical protein